MQNGVKRKFVKKSHQGLLFWKFINLPSHGFIRVDYTWQKIDLKLFSSYDIVEHLQF
jgi:hypothetical protein